MDVNSLNAEIARKGLSIPKLADSIGISKKTLYSRIQGKTLFKQDEIMQISKVLCLNGEQIFLIFFADHVS